MPADSFTAIAEDRQRPKRFLFITFNYLSPASMESTDKILGALGNQNGIGIDISANAQLHFFFLVLHFDSLLLAPWCRPFFLSFEGKRSPDSVIQFISKRPICTVSPHVNEGQASARCPGRRTRCDNKRILLSRPIYYGRTN